MRELLQNTRNKEKKETLSVARSAGVFFERAKVFACESARKLKREEKMGASERVIESKMAATTIRT